MISVTDTDIALGVAQEPCECPIARAMLAAFPGQPVPPWVAVYSETVAVAPSLEALSDELLLPLEARDFIQAFDHGRAARPGPFSFTLNVPDWLAALYHPAVTA